MFVHLHCHSHYSFLRAVPSPAEIIAAAAEHAMPAVALTDTGGLYAAVPFYLAAREAGVKPIVGAVLEIEMGNPYGEIPRPPRRARDDREKMAAVGKETLVLLATDHTGYSNLCHLVTEQQLQGRPVSLEVLNAHHAGLIALYAPGSASNRAGSDGCATRKNPAERSLPMESESSISRHGGFGMEESKDAVPCCVAGAGQIPPGASGVGARHAVPLPSVIPEQACAPFDSAQGKR